MNKIIEPEVIAAINQGRKIVAVKLLRELRGIGLKESKDLIDSYLSGHQDDENVKPAVANVSSGGVFVFNIILVLVILGLASFVLIKYF